ncbi:MAG: phosphotransferase [Alphaproteobacteria bacterium]|nr:phosphotransferase [Alphaproteobacteria bacterium]
MTLIDPRFDARNEFIHRCGLTGSAVTALKGDASFRRYFRLLPDGGTSLILMDDPPPHNQTAAFAILARGLRAAGFSAPNIVAEDVSQGFLLLEDLGLQTYSQALAAGADETALYEAATGVTLALHRCRTVDLASLPAYDFALYCQELELFPGWYLPALGSRPSPAALADYQSRWRAVLAPILAARRVLVLRDFHVDNLMVLNREGVAGVGLLDFQDAAAGHPVYDLVSLLDDARRQVAPAVVSQSSARFRTETGQSAADFDRDFAILSLQRNLKILGIFVRLAVRDRKPGYLDFIPHLWSLVSARQDHPELASVKGWLAEHCPQAMRRQPTAAEIAAAMDSLAR